MNILDLEKPYLEQTYRQVCPAVMVTLEALGAAVATEVLDLAAAQWAGLPIVQSVQLKTADDQMKSAARIAAAIQTLHQLELIHAVRQRGWTLRHLDGLSIFLFLPTHDGEQQAYVQSVLTTLGTHFVRTSHGTSILTGIFLSDADQASAMLRSSARRPGEPTLELAAFTGGCYVVETANVYGLTFGDQQRWISMIATWIFELLTTPLGPAVAGLPYPSVQSWRSFGLARWRLPTEDLLDVLTHRWQLALLTELLAPASEQQPYPTMLLEPPPGWHTGDHSAFFAGRTWSAWPNLSSVTALHANLDAEFEQALDRLDQAAGREDQRLDHLLVDLEKALPTEVTNLLDTPGPARLNTTCRLLGTARSAAERAASDVEERALRLETQLETVEQAQRRQGQALDTVQEQFPRWTLRAWLGVLWRPWRWPRIILRYLQLRRAAQAYLGVLENLYLLQRRRQELAWQTAYWCRLGEMLADILEQLNTFRRNLIELQGQLTEDQNHVAALQAQLEAAALPIQTLERLYERGYARPQMALDVLLGTSPQLSDYAAMQAGAAYLNTALAEQARERFEFVAHLRLDQLLMRTYRAAELRARLSELLEASGPFCAYDRSQFSPDERAGVVRTTWLGLPDGEASPLVDLVDGDHLQAYSGGVPNTVTAVQVITGLRAAEAVCLDDDNRIMQLNEKEESHE
jgi:hypothetical protein